MPSNEKPRTLKKKGKATGYTRKGKPEENSEQNRTMTIRDVDDTLMDDLPRPPEPEAWKQNKIKRLRDNAKAARRKRTAEEKEAAKLRQMMKR